MAIRKCWHCKKENGDGDYFYLIGTIVICGNCFDKLKEGEVRDEIPMEERIPTRLRLVLKEDEGYGAKN